MTMLTSFLDQSAQTTHQLMQKIRLRGDTVQWNGEDEEFNKLVAANEGLPDAPAGNGNITGRFPVGQCFDMRTVITRHKCGTAGCLVGNYMIQEDKEDDDAFSCSYWNINPSEFGWLFSTCTMERERWHLQFTSGNKPHTLKPNLDRLKKYIAYKRRKKDRLELDQAIQEADRRLIRQATREAARKAVSV